MTPKEMMLTEALHERRPYTLTKDDVEDVLIGENIKLYKPFVFSSCQAVISYFLVCLRRCMSKERQKYSILYTDGKKRIEKALDVC